jgi:uncharacterized protein with NRDE domain
MCLIALAWRVRDDLPLVVAANRDEFYDRPTRAAHAWDDAPHVLGGRDLRAGGGWLAVAGGGRFAAVTNIRYAQVEGGPSRGALVADFVRGDESALAFLDRLAARAAEYAGFHLIVGDGGTLAHFSNADARPSVLPPGIFGVSNAPPGVEWPKVALARDAVAQALHAREPGAVAGELLSFLTTPRGAAIESEVFVALPERGYGTRASTVVLVDAAGNAALHERAGGVTTSLAADATRS